MWWSWNLKHRPFCSTIIFDAFSVGEIKLRDRVIKQWLLTIPFWIWYHSFISIHNFYAFSSRFQDWSSDKTSRGLYSADNTLNAGKIGTRTDLVSEKPHKELETGSYRINRIKKSLKSSSFNKFMSKGFGTGQKVLDPQGPFLQKWNKIFVLSCVIAVSLDPLFFYVPVIDDDKKCLGLDNKMEITASVLRSFTDIFYILHIVFQFRTGFIAPSSRVFGRGVLVEDAWEIAKRYLSSYFLIDILAVLPLPQVCHTFSQGSLIWVLSWTLPFFLLLLTLNLSEVHNTKILICELNLLLEYRCNIWLFVIVIFY